VGAGCAESLRKLPGGGEAADVELIKRREVCPADDPVRESRAASAAPLTTFRSPFDIS
jgi:hypothetical protein